MSTTRRAQEGSPIAYERYMSNPIYADRRPIPANIVAEKAAGYPSVHDRDILFFLQALSGQTGGLRLVAAELLKQFPAIGPLATRLRFGPTAQSQLAWLIYLGKAEAPHDHTDDVHHVLVELCINPKLDLDALRKDTPKKGLVEVLQSFRQRWLSEQKARVIQTTLCKEVWELLDQSRSLGGITVIEAPSGSGKSYSAERWCSSRLGDAYFVTLSGITTRTNLMQKVATALGMAACQRKSSELQPRIEAFFERTKAMLVIDEAHFLWPQSIKIRANPELIDWIDTLVNVGARIALICTDQFARQKERVEKQTAWTSDQFKHRVREHRKLSGKPTRSDVESVTRYLLKFARESHTEAWTREIKSTPDPDALGMIVHWAMLSTLPLRTVRTIVEKARFLAYDRNGRDIVTLRDVSLACDSNELSDLALNNVRRSETQSAPARTSARKRARLPAKQMSSFSISSVPGASRNSAPAMVP